jgi:hypothetical protein
MVTSFADPAALTEESVASLRVFLHQMGREANQGEIGIVIGGDYFGIRTYDAEA